ncbi:peptidase M50B-like-domain-containing protein [Coprinopsis sp. MPI-PUGE-AT-0042]|nr:peptidase M50B-like-domain-containing protein [Coprinopsis sp. MPI-PUGE-AT-0042]
MANVAGQVEAGAYLVARDFKTRITPNETQRNTLIVAGAYVIIIGILWHVPYLNRICRLLTVGFHEMSHAFAGVLTCAKIHSIELDPAEGGLTRMRGGISWITLPAGYLGSSFIGACLIACGFNTECEQGCYFGLGSLLPYSPYGGREGIGCAYSILVLFTPSCSNILNYRTWLLILGMRALSFLFIGVMSWLYCLWDIIDDTLARKVNTSDASVFAEMIGCCGSRAWGFIWLIQAFVFFGLGVIVGLVAFKQNVEQQKEDTAKFLPSPGLSIPLQET